VTPRWAPVALAALLERVAEEERLLAEGKGLTLAVAVAARVRDVVVHTDAVLLERLLRNLVRNAVTYTNRGGVLLALRPRAGRVLLQVWDTGVGVAPESLEVIFEEFVQLRNEERDRSQGLGLGLALVRRISELLSIPVTVRSTVGKGSVFSVSLPLADAPAPAAAMVPAAGSEQPIPAGALVLVIDDDRAVRDGMAALLSSWRCRAILAEGLDDLLPQIAAERDVPSLIICDFRLRHGASGLDVLARLQSEYNDTLPAILVTGDTAPERLREAQGTNAIVLHKPLTPQRLREAMWRALRLAS
jgi:CheY-like chemotaxis protein/anti-sigma regulatory factor (Ser/Thr protein kinase)